jgi:hypothetical protein
MSNLPPKWKIKREIIRIGQSIRNFPNTISTLPTRLTEARRRAAYHLDFERLTRLIEGQAIQDGKVAIFLIFQRGPLPPSILATCRWLQDSGFAPFVISNGPLDEVARAQLVAHSWRLLERPNFGYDFGGYRDGILLLSRWGVEIDRLIVMNDSVWMLMTPDLMPRLDDLAVKNDIVGLLQDEKVHHDRSGGRPTDLRHIESYFYLFTASALAHPAFHSFWESYKMTDQKRLTIKYGELGFSRRMAAAGLRLSALTKRSSFFEKVMQSDDDFLSDTLRYGAYADSDLKELALRLSHLDTSDSEWRPAALELVRLAINRKRFNASYPFATDHIFGTHFLKKSQEPIFVEMRRQYLRALEAGCIAVPPQVVLQEVTAMTPR